MLGGFVDGNAFEDVRQWMYQQTEIIRPQILNLAEAFDFTDSNLNSTIGHSDGRVYERLYDAALSSPLNRKDKYKGFDEYLGPYTRAKL